jgi:hypothetical protein
MTIFFASNFLSPIASIYSIPVRLSKALDNPRIKELLLVAHDVKPKRYNGCGRRTFGVSGHEIQTSSSTTKRPRPKWLFHQRGSQARHKRSAAGDATEVEPCLQVIVASLIVETEPVEASKQWYRRIYGLRWPLIRQRKRCGYN